MRRRTLLALIALTALLLLSCSLASRFAGQAQESAVEAAQVAAQAADKAPTPETGASQPEAPQGEETVPRSADESPTTPAPTPTPSPAPTPTPSPAPGTAPHTEGENPEAPQGEAGPLALVSPNYLDSYRAHWLTKIHVSGQDEAIGMQYRLEWTKEPAAQHVWVDMGVAPFAEAIWIKDDVWIKVGGNWIKPQDQEAEQGFENFHEAWDTDDDMVLAGAETVNGVHSKHYVYDFDAPAQGIAIHREVWVADEADLPTVPVRGILRMENKTSQGTTITEIEANITDINAPIEIKPPM